MGKKRKELTDHQKDNLEKFLLSNVPEWRNHSVKGDERTFVCPFCKGGRRNEWSFDLNIRKGVARCWRAKNCGWTGSVEKLIMDTVNVDYDKARDILNGGRTPAVITNQLQKFVSDLMKGDDSVYNPRVYTEWPGCKPLSKVDYYKREDIFYWIDFERGFDPDEFLERHDVVFPPQFNEAEDMVCFNVYTKNSKAYQLYRFDNFGEDKPKTKNPEGAKLSRMLYNYNNVLKKRVVFVTEGIFDCARLDSFGFGAVASFGVRLQDYQEYLLHCLKAEEICFAYDGDATEYAVKAGKSLASQTDKMITFLDLPKDKDPDDLYEGQVYELYQERRVISEDSS